jgi:hypothetical protein
MVQFSTVLFIDNFPYGYRVTHEGHRYHFTPTSTPDSAPRPGITSYSQDGQWMVEGTADATLIDQIRKILVQDPASRPRQNVLSAAP